MDYSLVGLSKQGLQAQQDGLSVVSSSPFVLEDVETDAARKVHVGMVDRGPEQHGGRSVRIVRRKFKTELQGEAGVGGFIRSFDSSPPRKEIAIGRGEGRHARRRRCHQLHKLSLQSVCVVMDSQ